MSINLYTSRKISTLADLRDVLREELESAADVYGIDTGTEVVAFEAEIYLQLVEKRLCDGSKVRDLRVLVQE
jgi:hypothetical protein